MTIQVLNAGAAPNDGSGDNLREGALKINFNFSEIYSTFGDGNTLLSEDLNLGSIKILSSNSVESSASLSTIDGDSNRGQLIHVQDENAIYYVNGNSWHKLLTDANLPVTNYTDSLNQVAYSGDYTNLINKPTIPADVTDLTDVSGFYARSTDVPTELDDLDIIDGAAGQVLTTDGNGNYSFQTVAGSSNAIGYTDLSVTVGIPNADGNLSYNDTTGVFNFTPPNLSVYQLRSELGDVATSNNYNSLDDLPNLTVYAVSTDISSVGFSGEYSDLQNPPSIPQNVSELVNDANYIDKGDIGVTNATEDGNGSLTYSSITGTFTYTPPDITNLVSLTDLSALNSETPSGDGQLVYDNTLGTFTYTPPDLSIYALITSVSDLGFSGDFTDMTNTPTTIAGYGITDAFNGVFTSLTNKPTTLSGYGITDGLSTSATLVDLGITDGNAGQVLTTDGAGVFTFQDAGDSIGNLTVTNSTFTTTDGEVTLDSDVDITGTLTVDSLSTTDLTITGSGTTTFDSGNDIVFNATNRVSVTDTPFRLASRTSAQITAIGTFQNGDMIYDSDRRTVFFYRPDGWGSLPWAGLYNGSAGGAAVWAGPDFISIARSAAGDYTVSFPDNTFANAGQYTFTVTPINSQNLTYETTNASGTGFDLSIFDNGTLTDHDFNLVVWDLRGY